MILWNKLKANMMRYRWATVEEGEAVMTYEQLCVFAERFGERLTESCYGILCRSEMAAAMALLACVAAGKTAVPMPSRYGKESYLSILDRADPPCVITDCCGELTILPMEPKEEPVFSHPSPAVILFTSGSTGVSKGVMLSEENLLTNLRDISSYFPVTEKDTVLISRPIYHSSVLTGELFTALLHGCRIVFSSEAFQPSGMLRLMREKGVTVFGTTPTLAATLARFCHGGVEGVRLLSISGERMTDGVAGRIRGAFPNAAVYCGYGLSEASPRVAYLPPELFDTDPTCTGVALPSVRVRVVRPDGLDCERGEVGEVLVKGASVMRGYLGDPERTARVIRKGWLHTGDLGYIGKNGRLYIQGRADDMIIRAGMNSYPAEIENALSADERVEELAVYGYEEGGTQQIGLKIKGRFSSVEEVARLCRACLPAYQIPSRVELVNEFPRTASGKQRKP